MDLLTQLNRAVDYIEAHIRDDLVLTDISKVTAYSPYHFGRLFYYIAGMPLSEYVRKRKLSLAAAELQNTNIKVVDLAMKYGYDNSDSFTRAFAKQHGVTPTAARRSGVFLKILLPLSKPGITSGITMVFVPSVSTFIISRMLGGGANLLIGDLIEQQFLGNAYNPQLGSAISLILMIFILLSMALLNQFDEDETEGMIV